jgi:hypothetical protein
VLEDRAGASLIKLPALDVVLNEIEPLIGKVDIASIRIDQPDFEVARARDGRLNLAALDAGGRQFAGARPKRYRLQQMPLRAYRSQTSGSLCSKCCRRAWLSRMPCPRSHSPS